MKLYKYRYGSKRDLESLINNSFYASDPSKLNDPCEGVYIESIVRDATLHEFFKAEISRFYEEASRHGIYSLSQIAVDELLWAYYANSHYGFCIEYDRDELLKVEGIKTNFIVDYRDDVPNLNFGTVFIHNSVTKLLKLILGRKSKKWLHEAEERLIVEKHGLINYSDNVVTSIYFGIRMPRKVDDLPTANDQLSDKLQQVCREQVIKSLQGRDIKYYQMVLRPNSYDLIYEEIKDPYLF